MNKFKKIINKRRTLIFLSIICLIITGYFTYYTVQVNSLVKVGYTKDQAKQMVNPFSIYNIVSREIDKLKNEINQVKTNLKELGISNDDIDNVSEKKNKLLDKKESLKQIEAERSQLLDKLIKDYEQQAKKFKVTIKYTSNDQYNKYLYIKKLMNDKYNSLIKDYEKYLKTIGYTNSEINNFKDKKNIVNSVIKLEKVYNQEKKNEKENNGFQTTQLKNQAMRMFRETNAYRASKGLAPYKYNYAKQNCVFVEAKAYARNKNPHNWLCPCANENASLASINSDYVSIAMTFFKNDPPHERVLSGNYSSVAIAFVEQNGMVYMIMDVFN
jgi:uncharacterized protein YkwD